MLNTAKSVASLLLSYGLLLLANGMFGTLLGLRSKLEGFSTEITGLIMAAYFIGMLLGAMNAARVVASAGHIRSFAAFASIMSVAVLAHLLILNPISWIILRAICGFCMAGMVMIVESWLNERSTNENRGRVLSLYMMTSYLGGGLGQLILPLADPASFELFSVASIIFSIALVPILLTRSAAPKPTKPERMSLKALYSISPVGVIGTFTAGLSNSSINSMGPVFAKSIDMTIAEISFFMASILLGGMLLQFPVGRLSDLFDRRTVMIVVSILTTVASLAIVWASGEQNITFLYLTALIYGGVAYTIYPMSSAQANDLVDKERLVQVSGSLLFAYGLGASSGPIITSQFMAYFGPETLFLCIAGGTSFLTLFVMLRIVQRPAGTKKSRFLPLAGLGASSKQLYTSVQKTFVKKRPKKSE
ncbi:MFS transporter [Sneathiella aquimaris]|uniref:MFS transporter n=1 Tax=Sneathiella aquimaris TaxID=2599305 RepID=UPI00146A71BC|nr:MFS transporter [Sneathiella aquimaris]